MGVPEAVALEIPVEEGSPASRVPPRIRRRLLQARESSAGAPATAEEIEAKLRDAHLRRQQFHEALSCKARRTVRSTSQLSQEEDPKQRLEAKLVAANQKRLNLLAKEQNRLAKLDEMRQAAKNDAEMRFNREREELGMRVEYRVRQAEENRIQLLQARLQRRAALEERTKRFLGQRVAYENKYRERVRSAFLQKRNAAEKRRIGLLEAEKTRAQGRLSQAHLATKTAFGQGETERSKLKEQPDDKLQRAKRQQERPQCSVHISSVKHGDFLSRKLARCWRRFIMSRKTTVVLARAFDVLEINQESAESLPFEKLALCIESPKVVETTRALLDRLESRFILSQSSSSSSPENINHLLKHLGSPKRMVLSSSAGRARVTPKKTNKNADTGKLPRYSPRVVLCSYMIRGHPSAVFNVRGEREKVLLESAENFVKEFELLTKTILDGLDGACILRQPTLDTVSPGPPNHQESSSVAADRKKFRSQLVSFDKAWCTYLYHFVVWKAKDAKALEEDLVTAACKLELSMMRTCKLTTESRQDNLTNNLKAIQKQVMVDQKLLREKVWHLGGEAGIERMQLALSETRSKFLGAKENGSPLATAVAKAASPSRQPPLSAIKDNSDIAETPSRVVQSLCRSSSSPSECNTGHKDNSGPETSRVSEKLMSEKLTTEIEAVQSLVAASPAPSESSAGDKAMIDQMSTVPEKMPTENEHMVNEILHGSFPDSFDDVGKAEGDFKAKVRETMEKAFWDVVVDSMRGDKPDYSYLINLVKEVRDALHQMAPNGWKEEITNNVNVEMLSQVLESNTQDTQYLGQILQYSLGMLRKLSSPAKEDQMKNSHDKLLNELIEHSECNDRGQNSFIIAISKGLRFTMEELKALQAEVSKARIQLLKPIIKGSGGVEYLQKAFADRYGSRSSASISLPSTIQWISTSKDMVEEEWNEYVSSFQILPATDHVQPFVTTLRTGRGFPDQQHSTVPAAECTGLPECTGERLDKLIRIGLLQLISSMEGLQRKSVPETFKLNWLRLRSVQSQFQQVIVIATSMLVQRQVLMSENSETTPSELESAILELFNTLTELLDDLPDVSTDKIIEVMIHSSTSSGSCSDQVANRKQILTRVFLKSLQTDDTVFRKVSRSVYCAFRAITLGGSGPKGKKLAEAALRRIGATYLTDRVVKASELLIKVATVSEQVHGPWYIHLL
ncbi:uncharacterized protein LOC100841358 isoform X2 [Brachypodium distachyon]|uniref:T-complex protein 11 n=1 Tax=Brachypodium distachyon TaxID=15368 RepID=I1IAI6_BRADI|nr:uncharacterized protein LOC100841358 isoform X2 [Brachypodium distachyon]KQJ99890.1 hypothetical protein BRADI_3g45830v3 [Brachypodium distachyon]|eukprot:XP_010235546.1 uncharacterized protein LOC100841358 isoform X2 [Brachypodium distachyon]